MIVVVDSGTGNFQSVVRMVQSLGFKVKLTNNYSEIEAADKIILPGVGHFDKVSLALSKNNLSELIKLKAVVQKTPILGICVGMQLFCNGSEEGKEPGFGLINADVVKFSADTKKGLKIPHMGWNNVVSVRENPLIPMGVSDERFYFVHSYYVKPKEDNITIGVSEYGSLFCSAFMKYNLFGVQFHPEKSHRFGKQLIRNFLEI